MLPHSKMNRNSSISALRRQYISITHRAPPIKYSVWSIIMPHRRVIHNTVLLMWWYRFSPEIYKYESCRGMGLTDIRVAMGGTRTLLLSGNIMRTVCGSECVTIQRTITGVNIAGWIRHPWRSYSTCTYKERQQVEYTGLMPAELSCIYTKQRHHM